MLKLLLVDDEPVIRNGLSHMIGNEKGLESQIRGASDGIEALYMLDTFQPDLLITDIHMPEMDGLQLIQEAQKRNVKRFVVLSGYDEFNYAQQAIRLQVLDYLLKPIHQKELSALLHRTAEEVEKEEDGNGISGIQYPVTGADQEPLDGNQMRVRKFRIFVQNNYKRDVSLEEVAMHLELHPNYLCNLLKREIGTTFIHYLHQVRIEQAKKLLVMSRVISLEQVAKRVGYENPRHFYKVFKQYVGQTPGSYRNEKLAGG